MNATNIDQLDAIDRMILRVLLEDGRITNKQLAERVALSPSPCWQRVRRLEDDGYIKGYTAILDQERLCAPDTVFVEIEMAKHEGAIPEEIGDRLAQIPEVLELYLASGQYDFILKLAVNGTKGFDNFIRGKLSSIPGILHTRSSFAVKCLKRVQAHIPD